MNVGYQQKLQQLFSLFEVHFEVSLFKVIHVSYVSLQKPQLKLVTKK